MSEHVTFRGRDGLKDDLDEIAEREGYEDRSDLLREVCERVVAETPDAEPDQRIRADGGRASGTVGIDPEGASERASEHYDPDLYDLSFESASNYAQEYGTQK